MDNSKIKFRTEAAKGEGTIVGSYLENAHTFFFVKDASGKLYHISPQEITDITPPKQPAQAQEAKTAKAGK